ncbi:MAG TPA: sigma-70 family RNA polymerase sigma factor [Planctomycetaceae bacterium]|nr:sigma-70 family RNA polymerase sigma factor [Planctomycetaceae bacterium]
MSDHPAFHTTRWSLIARAAQDSSPESRAALEELCDLYWYPLYAFVRREGVSPDEAQDLTQGFFVSLLERQDLRAVHEEKGRFRSFLRTSMKHFLLNYWKHNRAQKRGGGNKLMSLDFEVAEQRYSREPELTPDQLFDRQWALTVLDLAMAALEESYFKQGKEQLFLKLKPALTGASDSATGVEVAERLSMSEGAVRTALHRLRKDFRTELRRQVAETLDESENTSLDEEISYLFAALNPGT